MNITSDVETPVHPGGRVPQGGDADDRTHILVYVLVPLGALVLIATLSFLVSTMY